MNKITNIIFFINTIYIYKCLIFNNYNKYLNINIIYILSYNYEKYINEYKIYIKICYSFEMCTFSINFLF